MENAVPIVTQAPGAQPLQIQPGLLAQVMSSEDTKQSRLFFVLFSSWKLERVAFPEGLLCCSLEKWAAIKVTNFIWNAQTLPNSLSCCYIGVASDSGKTVCSSSLRSVGISEEAVTGLCWGGIGPGTFLDPPELAISAAVFAVVLVNCMLLKNIFYVLILQLFMNCISVHELWERCSWQRQGPDGQGAHIVSLLAQLPKVLSQKKHGSSQQDQMEMGATYYIHFLKETPISSELKKKSSLSSLVLPLVHLSLQVFSWCQVVSGMFLGSKVSLALSYTAWKRWSAVQKWPCAVRYIQTSRFMPVHWVARVCLLVQLLQSCSSFFLLKVASLGSPLHGSKRSEEALLHMAVLSQLQELCFLGCPLMLSFDIFCTVNSTRLIWAASEKCSSLS